MEKPAYYGILPANIRYDNRLKPMEKIMYCEITALANKNGYCNASNSYFAELYEVHKNTVGNWVNHLIQLGYLKSVLIYKENSKEIQSRKLYLTNPPINEKIDTPQQKDLYPINEKIDTPINKKIEGNITSINNTSNNNNNKEQVVVEDKKTNISNGGLNHAVTLLIKARKIKVWDVVKLNKDLGRIKEVFNYCDKYNKSDGWLIGCLKGDWHLEIPKIEEIKYMPEREVLN